MRNRLNSIHRFVCILLLIGFSNGLSIGCNRGPKIVPAKGIVVFEDGSPVTVGTVETNSLIEKRVQSTGKIQPDGSFVLSTFGDGDGAMVGEHQCVVVQFVMAEDIQGHKASTLGVVNPMHNSYATSGLKVTVPDSGTNDLKLVVKGVKATRGVDSKHKPFVNDGDQSPPSPK
ncbi:MAG: hypothetical protein ACK56W_24685 [Pirellula sp.]|jgi:hypothetical protein|nr:hypothetical protein [Pirellula sp.]